VAVRTTLLSILAALALAPPARAELVDAVAAVVNGEIITLGELEGRAGAQLPPASATGELGRRRATLLRRLADDAIADKLIEKEAEAQGALPTNAELDAAVEEIKRTNGIDDATLEKALAQQGMSRRQYREMLRAQLTRMKVVEFKVKGRVSVTEDDVKARYAKMAGDLKSTREVRASDLYVPPSGDAKADRERLEKARARVAAGEPFAQVAKELGGPLAASGGDLGWFAPGTMLPALEKVAFALKKGELSPVFEAGGGLHVVRVEDERSTGGARPLAEAREEIRQQLTAEKLQKATDEYLGELRKSADVEVRLP
jgi:peptidyl-prolyl cis-trans isomerase SurA